MTIQELKEVVQDIVEDSIEKCVVAGTMEGRAVPLSLKVEGEVVAKMTCNFDKEDWWSHLSDSNWRPDDYKSTALANWAKVARVEVYIIRFLIYSPFLQGRNNHLDF